MTHTKGSAVAAAIIFIVIVLIMIGLSMALANWFVSGENYNYTLSESEIQDQWVTETCIKLQINSPECDLVYGGSTDHVSDGKIK